MRKLLLVVMSLAFVNVSLAKSKKSDRKPAETHGGVYMANAAMSAVANSNYGAEADGGGLFRVLAVAKKTKCADANVFEVSYGNANSETGIETISEKMLLVANHAPTADNEYNFTVSRYSGKCK